MPKYAIFAAKSPFKCGICLQIHQIGTRALKEGEVTIAADCKWPDRSKKPMAHSDNKFLEIQQDTKDAVALRLRTAREIVAKEHPDAQDYSDYNYLLAECMRELYGSIWLEKDMR